MVLQSLFVLVFSGIGGGVGKVWMWYTKHLRNTKLEPTLQQEQEGEFSCINFSFVSLSG